MRRNAARWIAMRRWNRQVIVALVLCVGMSGLSGPASAAIGDPSSASTSYVVIESEIGGSGCANKTAPACGASTSYSLDPSVDDGGSSLGESAVGSSASASYQAGSGFNTTAQPGLTMVVNTSSVSLGLLSVGTAKTATASFSVKDYTSWGYAVTIIGSPPSNAGHVLAPMGTQSANSTGCSPTCASNNGVEQFGINMRLNASPAAFGAEPAPIPSAAFSLSNPSVVIPLPYRTADAFRYFSGDTIASAPSSSGETDYTISFMANMSTTTPGGTYGGGLTIVTTGTY
jgi:hypothetical protein